MNTHDIFQSHELILMIFMVYGKTLSFNDHQISTLTVSVLNDNMWYEKYEPSLVNIYKSWRHISSWGIDKPSKR